MPSVTRKPRTSRPVRDAAESKVFDAVERLLAEGTSFTELGIQQISDEAGIGRSTFYVHFADKTDLLIRLTRASTAELFAAADRWLESDYEDGYQPLEDAITEVCRQRREHRLALGALAELATYDAAIGDFWREQILAFAQRLAKKLRSEQRLGRTGDDVDPLPTATFLVWGVERAFEQQMRTGSPRTDARLVRATARALWTAIYGAPPAP